MQLSGEDATLANILGAAALLLVDRMQSALAAEEHVGLSYASGLLSIQSFEGCSIDQLSRSLAISHSGTVRLVDQLEEDRLVRRSRQGRTVALHLTARGRRAAERMADVRLAAVWGVLEELESNERRTVEPVLRSLLGQQTESFNDLLHTCRACSIEACQASGKRCPVAGAL